MVEAEFNSDDHYICYCGQESLRWNGVAMIVNKRVWNAVLGCNLKNDRMISLRVQGKPFNITVIQVYAPTSNGEETEQFFEDLQDLLEVTPKKDGRNLVLQMTTGNRATYHLRILTWGCWCERSKFLYTDSICCCCCVASVVSDTVWPHRRQPTRLPCPWDSPGKNTGVGRHCLLQCMKVNEMFLWYLWFSWRDL